MQFAFMGGAFAQAVLGIERPRVALLSNGEEAERGSEPLLIAAHEELSACACGRGAGGQRSMDFAGNIEGDDAARAARPMSSSPTASRAMSR